MADVFDLSASISVDTSRAERGLTEVGKKAESVAAQLKRAGVSAEEWEKVVGKSNAAATFGKIESAVKKTDSQMRSSAQSTKHLAGAFQGLTSATSTLTGPLNGVASRLSSIASLATGVTSKGGAIGVALGALAAVSVGTAAAIYKLVSSASEATGKLHDLAAQTGFSVETLSALKNASELSGGSIDSVTSALFIFETKMGEAKDKTSEMSAVFKALNIDTTNNEKALRQAISAILAMKNAEDQATLGKKLFGRSVKDLLGAIKEAGSLDAFLNAELKKGTLITTEAARRGDQLSDAITRIGQEFSATSRAVAREFEPVVTSALQSFSRWLRDNQGELVATARGVAGLIKDVSSLANFIYQISPIKLTVEILRVTKNVEFSSGTPDYLKAQPGSGIGAQKSYFEKLWDIIQRGPDPNPRDLRDKLGKAPPGGWPVQTKEQIAATAKANADAQKKAADDAKKLQDQLNRLMGGRGGRAGGGGGGADAAVLAKRLADLRLKAVLDELQFEVEANKRALERQWIDFEEYRRRISSAEEKRHAVIADSLNAEMSAAEKVRGARQREIAIQEVRNKQSQEEFTHKKRLADIYDEQGALLDRYNRLVEKQTEAVADAQSQMPSWIRSIYDEIKAFKEAGWELSEYRKQILLNNAAEAEAARVRAEGATRLRQFIPTLTRPRTVGPGEPDKVTDLGGGSVAQTDPEGYGVPTGLDRSRRVFQEHYDEMRRRADDLAYLINDSIAQGFRGGMKQGVLTFAMGILEMIQSRVLTKLSDAIFDAIMQGVSRSAGGGGKGGFLSGLIGILLGGIGGIFGGGKGGGSLPRFPAPGGKIPLPPLPSLPPLPTFPGRAMGGPAFENMPLVVGDRPDRQWEVFVPRSNGHVFTQDQFRMLAGLAGRGSEQTHHHHYAVNININSKDPNAGLSRDTLTQAMNQLRRGLQANALKVG